MTNTWPARSAKAFALRLPALCLGSAIVVAAAGQGPQGLAPSQILKPLAESWTSYSGDYSGKRYSSLTQVNQSNVKNLTLAWVSKVAGGPGAGAGRGGPSGPPTIVG